MKKFSFILILFVLLAGTGFSQVSIGVNAGGSFPSSDFSDAANTGFGIAVSVNYSLPAAPVEVFVQGGLDNFAFSDVLKTFEGDYKYQPITVFGGARYLFMIMGSMFTPYVGGRLGLMSLSTNAPNSSSSSAFAWSPQAGFRYEFSPVVSLDVNAYYTSASKNGGTTAWFGAQGGVVFAL